MIKFLLANVPENPNQNWSISWLDFATDPALVKVHVSR